MIMLVLPCLVLVLNAHEILAQTCKNEYDNKFEEFNQRLDSLQQQVNLLSSPAPEPVVTWKVKLSSDRVYSKGDTVKFDEVMVSEGPGYNATTGIFTVPVSGVYSFAVQSCSMYGKWDHLALKYNGEVIALGKSGDSGWHDCNTDVVTKKFAAGSELHVERVFGGATSSTMVSLCSLTASLITPTN